MEHFRMCRLNLRLLIATVAHVVSIILFPLPTTTFGSVSQGFEALPYGDYCRDFLSDKVRQQHSPDQPSSAPVLGFHRGGFHGGSPRFDTGRTGFSFRRRRQSTLFVPTNVTMAYQDGRYLVEGFFHLQNNKRPWIGSFDRTRVFRPDRSYNRGPISQFVERRMLNVKGLWIAHSGILCLAGCFQNTDVGQSRSQEDCQVKITFHYPTNVSIIDPFILGKVESKKDRSDPSFFESIFVTAIPDGPYLFSKEEELGSTCTQSPSNVPEKIDVWKDKTAACKFPWFKQPLNVIWDPKCRGQDCSPFGVENHTSTTTLLVQNLLCEKEMVHGYFVFSHWGKQGTDVIQNDIFALEGKWDSGKGQLCMLACHLKGAFNDSETGPYPDCDIQVTLQFPTTLDLHFRYSVVGHVERRQNSPLSPFLPFSFTGHMDMTYGTLGWSKSAPEMVYSYSSDILEQAKGKCQADITDKLQDGQKGYQKLKFPNGEIFSDLGFEATLKDSSGLEAVIYVSPIAINNRTNRFFNPSAPFLFPVNTKRLDNMSISFDLHFGQKKVDVKLVQNTSSLRLSAEGVYNSRTGKLCLIACRTIEFSARNALQLDGDGQDCQVHMDVKYPPMNPGFLGPHGVHGKINSLREHNDSLFFGILSLSSDLHLYREQASESTLQIDVEIIMGIISLTMVAICIGLQLCHVKRQPNMLSHVSLLMLSVLIMGQVIPLVLNFEALFSNRLRQNVLQWSGGWLELNEVVVRLMTMVVFLLLLRLLHLAWGGKLATCTTEGPWYMERKILYTCLSTYVLGGLITFSIHATMGGIVLKRMKGYAGLVVDFFLFPQVVGNYVWEVQGTVLSPPFYFGMTLVRSLPHIYDLMRKFNFVPRQNNGYYYANPNWDFYSRAWDLILPCSALLLAVLVFFQQRFGGSCFLPSHWRHKPIYKIVSTDAS